MGVPREHLRRVNCHLLTPRTLGARLHAEYPGHPHRHPRTTASVRRDSYGRASLPSTAGGMPRSRGSFCTSPVHKAPQPSDPPRPVDPVVPFKRYGCKRSHNFAAVPRALRVAVPLSAISVQRNHDLPRPSRLAGSAPREGAGVPRRNVRRYAIWFLRAEARCMFSPQRSGGEVDDGEGYRHPPPTSYPSLTLSVRELYASGRRVVRKGKSSSQSRRWSRSRSATRTAGSSLGAWARTRP